MTYQISIESGDLNYSEIEPLYRQHFGEMRARLLADGIAIGEYKPRLNLYFDAFAGGWLINYIVRKDGVAIGYSNVYITSSMHTGELMAREDTIYILPAHRNGIGKKLVLFILSDLRRRGVKSVHISPVTDLRVGKIWKRMGFKEVAMQMVYNFEDTSNVPR